ncbi:hypothetical protein M9458_047818, partial [Cirrhinus mrigala]
RCVSNLACGALLRALLHHDGGHAGRLYQLQKGGHGCYGPEGPGTTCSVNWAARTANNVSYIVCLFIFCLILPFMVIVYSYGRLLQAITQ